MLIVTQPFIGYGFDYAQPGQLIDPPPDVRAALFGIGVVAEYETKVIPLPESTKKKPLELSQADHRQPGRTLKSSARNAR